MEVYKNSLELINDFYSNENYVKLKKQYADKTIWNIFDKTTDERLHTKFLCFLLDPSENYSIDTFALEQLLRLLIVKMHEQGIENQFLKKIKDNMFIRSDNNILCEFMKSEFKVPNENSIFDIFGKLSYNDNKFHLIIENKVKSHENDRDDNSKAQTNKYEQCSRQYDNSILVYLSVDKEDIINKNFICITYQELLDYVIEPALHYSTDNKSQNLIQDYIKVLSRIGKRKGDDTIMAISTYEKQLLKNVYDSNKELFERMFNVLKEDTEVAEEERTAIDTFLAYNSSKKGKWLYNGETYSSKGLVFTIVKELLEKQVNLNILTQFKMHSSPLLIKEQDNENKYDVLEVNNETYYIRNCCPKEDVQNLVDKFNIKAEYKQV